MADQADCGHAEQRRAAGWTVGAVERQESEPGHIGRARLFSRLRPPERAFAASSTFSGLGLALFRRDMRQRIVPWAIALLAAVHGLAAAQSSRNEERSAPEVRKLAITGVKSVNWHDLSRSINTRASKCRSLLLYPFCLFSKSPYFYERRYFDPLEFRRDVLRVLVFYYRRGWRDARQRCERRERRDEHRERVGHSASASEEHGSAPPSKLRTLDG